jgi:chemotaxis protein methyltransferase CheR
MNKEKKYIFSLSEYKKFIDFIKNQYFFDLSYFEVLITKRRIENFFHNYNISDFKSAIELISKNKFWIMLQDYLIVPTTEMFRDVDIWKKLKEKYLSRYKNLEPKIWLPDISTDDELDTMLIVLKEAGFENNFDILVSSPFEKVGNKYQSNAIDEKKMEIARLNYKNYCGKDDIDSCYNLIGRQYFLKKNLYINVNFKKYAFWTDQIQENYFDIVIIRNRLLYYNPEAHKKYIEKIYKSLKNRAILILGINENFAESQIEKNFTRPEKNCQIFIKKK